MELEAIPLRSFLEDPAAPPGTVYTWLGEPFLQLHLFENEYTVFWLGASPPDVVANEFVRAVATANALLQQTGFESERSWSVRLALFQKTDIGHQSYGLSEFSIGKALPDQILAGKIESVFSPAEPITAACYAFATLGNNRRSIELWADTKRCRAPRPEVGLTSNIPLMETAWDIFTKTSSLGEVIPKETLRDLFYNRLPPGLQKYFTK